MIEIALAGFIGGLAGSFGYVKVNARLTRRMRRQRDAARQDYRSLLEAGESQDAALEDALARLGRIRAAAQSDADLAELPALRSFLLEESKGTR